MLPGTQTKATRFIALGLALHIAAYLGRDIAAVLWGVGIAAAAALVYGCAELLGGKGYPKILALPAAALSVVWVWVCVLVPDREYRRLPRAQREGADLG